MDARYKSMDAPTCPGCAARNRRIAQLEAQSASLEQRITKLEEQLAVATRASKRQAAPRNIQIVGNVLRSLGGPLPEGRIRVTMVPQDGGYQQALGAPLRSSGATGPPGAGVRIGEAKGVKWFHRTIFAARSEVTQRHAAWCKGCRTRHRGREKSRVAVASCQ
ncbi:MAG: ABC transporter C-terminal domain-containing protein [Planctomycetota bacterium]|nr:ABC transporter C-terminal domain-containing protein [Planctomycetota bacterium]